MTLLIIVGDFDLSVGSMMALCSLATATIVTSLGPISGFFASLFVGVALGLFNGTVVTRLRIPTLVATLGTLYIFLSLGYIVVGDSFKGVTNAGFLKIPFIEFFSIPITFLLMLAVTLLCGVLLRRTNYGRMVRAIGTNQRAATVAGLPVSRIRVTAFIIVGSCVSITAFLQTAQLSSATPSMGTGFELNVIATVILGGTSLRGGEGTLFGTFCASIFFAVMNNALNLYGVGSYWQYVAIGTIIVLALAFDSARRRMTGGKT
jgi:ribose transport system permease protein